MNITSKTWARMFQGKTSLQVAQQILGNLIGYRKTSLKRSIDQDNLASAIVALWQLGEPKAAQQTADVHDALLFAWQVVEYNGAMRGLKPHEAEMLSKLDKALRHYQEPQHASEELAARIRVTRN